MSQNLSTIKGDYQINCQIELRLKKLQPNYKPKTFYKASFQILLLKVHKKA